MTKKPFPAAVCLTLSMALALSACKPKPGEPTEEQKAAAAAAAAGTPAPAAAPVAAAPAAAVQAQASSAAIADLDKIAVIAKPLPPFPFIDFPQSVGEAFQGVDQSDFDQVSVIVGNKVHTVEGRTKLSRFDLSDAKLSEFQVKRDYTKAVLDMGGVKVNTAMPHEDAFYAANGLGADSEAIQKQRWDLDKKLKYESNFGYDVYFMPTATGRKWVVLMISDSKVRIFAIEEKTAPSSVKLAS